MGVCLLVAATSIACGGPGPQAKLSTVTVRFESGAEATAEVAVTKEQIETGLMFREELGSDDGMLFLLPYTFSSGFYMKNTLIPLSIAYLRRMDLARYEVVGLREMQPCPKDVSDCPEYPYGGSYEAALEMNRGWFEAEGVEVGDEMAVQGTLPAPFGGPSGPTPSGT